MTDWMRTQGNQPVKIHGAVVVTFGRECPEGNLPVYAVADEEEAEALIVLTCMRGPAGYLAPELIEEQTLEYLALFSARLDRGHELLKLKGRCRCKTTVHLRQVYGRFPKRFGAKCDANLVDVELTEHHERVQCSSCRRTILKRSSQERRDALRKAWKAM